MEPIPINWKDSTPLWIEQWPLTREKLLAAEELVQEQLKKNHIEPSTSPWNSPIFVIKKKSGKWRLLTDLRAVNASMLPMGALQPGIPSPAMVPREWHVLIIDLADCFFTIPVHPKDRPRFAFSLPKINHVGPHSRFQWKVLPQGMMNSPTICQIYVDRALQSIRKRYPGMYISHYMDDILFAYPDKELLQRLLKDLPTYLAPFGLVIAEDKIQFEDVNKYLGYVVARQTVRPQKVTIRRDNLHTLNDFQKLLGDINWLRPALGIPTYKLHNLFNILQGDSALQSPRHLTPAAEEELQFFEEQLKTKYLVRVDPDKDIELYIITTWHYPTAVLGQNEAPLEWIYTKHRFSKSIMPYDEQIALLIQSGRQRAIVLSGKDCGSIILPIPKEQLNYLYQMSEIFQIALVNYTGQIRYNYPKGKLWDFFKMHPFVITDIISTVPLNGVNIFTDGSRNRSAYWTTTKFWQSAVTSQSVQRNELQAVIQVLKDFSNQDINIIADSAYIVGVVRTIIGAVLSNHKPPIQQLFKELQLLLQHRNHKIFITHIRSHSHLPGPLVQGNELVDKLVAFASPQEEHQLFHNNAGSLHVRWKVPLAQARQIVKKCPICQPLQLKRGPFGVNPRGLQSNEIWQMDVTHFPSFGRQQYIHVTVDTFSKFIWATALTGETANHVIQHLLECFAIMGIPTTIKTDNAPAYSSRRISNFLQAYHIQHITGIEYNPQGQAIIERTHGILKLQIKKLKRRNYDTLEIPHVMGNIPRVLLHQALFVLNFLNLPQGEIHPAAEKHFNISEQEVLQVPVWAKIAADAEWQEATLLVKGRGYGLIALQNGTQYWLPSRWIQPRSTTTLATGPEATRADS